MSAYFTADQLQQATAGRWVGQAATAVMQGIYTDTRNPRPGAAFVALRGENFDGHEYLAVASQQGAAALVANEQFVQSHPDVVTGHVPLLAVPDTVKALGQLGRDWRLRVSPRTVAITGSVGKTTVKDLIIAVASRRFRVHGSRGNYNNLIGLPLEILGMAPDTEVLVVECGADRPGEIQSLSEICLPNIGVVTHVVPCHLERFGSVSRIAEEKGKLLTALQGSNPQAVVFSGCAERNLLTAGCPAPITLYGRGGRYLLRAENESLSVDGTSVFDLCEGNSRVRVQMQLIGAHQVDNALAAATVGRILEIPLEDIKTGLESCTSGWGRMKKTELQDGTIVIEDLYNSNPQSMQAALDFLSRYRGKRRIAVFGEMWDLGTESEHWHLAVGRQITRDHAEVLVTVGSKAVAFVDGALQGGRAPEEIQQFENTQEALQWLLNNRTAGALILIKGSRGMKMENISKGLIHG